MSFLVQELQSVYHFLVQWRIHIWHVPLQYALCMVMAITLEPTGPFQSFFFQSWISLWARFLQNITFISTVFQEDSGPHTPGGLYIPPNIHPKRQLKIHICEDTHSNKIIICSKHLSSVGLAVCKVSAQLKTWFRRYGPCPPHQWPPNGIYFWLHTGKVWEPITFEPWQTFQIFLYL